MTVKIGKSVTVKGLPYGDIEIDTDEILCNDIIFDGEFNPNHIGLFVIEIGGSYTPIFKAVWAPEHDALDVACDANMLDNLLIEDDEQDDRIEHEDDCKKPEDVKLSDYWTEHHEQCCSYNENFARLGNASEAFNLDNVGLRRVNLSKQDCGFLMLLAEARGANVDKLSDL